MSIELEFAQRIRRSGDSRTSRILTISDLSSTSCRDAAIGAFTELGEAGVDYRHLVWDQEVGPKFIAEFNPHVLILGVLSKNVRNSAALLHALRDRPVVGLNVLVPGAPCFVPDELAIGRLAARHLLEMGHRTLLCTSAAHDWALARCRGFLEECQSAGVTAIHNDGDIWDVTRRSSRGDWIAGSLNDLLTSLPKPAAIFAACDLWGAHVIQQARLAGIRVPEDLAIVGVDNDEVACTAVCPMLSSVAIPWRRMGVLAARAAISLARGRRTESSLVAPSGVVIRRSSDTVVCPDADVAIALRFIHQHADRPLTVAQIIRAVPVHQHRLERLFKRFVGRTMVAEIRRVHARRAIWLLSTTRLTVEQIAQQSGFRGPKKLAEALRKEYGQTPSQYRKSLSGQVGHSPKHRSPESVPSVR